MTIQSVVALPQQQQNENFAAVIPFRDTPVTFAVDVSWSTSGGGILEAEKQGVRRLCRQLSTSARNWTRILPWDTRLHNPVPISQIDELSSSGGTNPTVLTHGFNAATTPLQDCSLWFLFTDGYIDELAVQSFALGIGTRGFHGKACVIILYGDSELDSSPLDCNISVGQAVFAIAPNCAFLFYDTVKRELVVFQCKGCFRQILPKEDMEITLDSSTTWSGLPRTSYEELAKVSIPLSRQVDLNAVILSDGHVVNLEDLYKDRLGQAVASRILENDDDLKSILLTAQTRGMSREIEKWIARQKFAQSAIDDLLVPDIDGLAFSLVSRMVTAFKQGNNAFDWKTMRKRLRDTHTRNAIAYTQSIKSAERRRSERNTVVEDALARVRLNRESPGSPCTMSPVSPRPNVPRSEPYTPFIDRSQQYGQYQPSPLPRQTPIQTIFSKGYSLGRGSFASECYCDECSLCEDVLSPLALLLKTKPEEYSTEGDFPEAQSYEQVIFPLAMGNYPETDVMSSFICCERCAYYICKLGSSPLDDKIVGYIPLVSSKLETNRNSKRKGLDVALEGRFDHAIIDQVYLAILYNKLDEVVGERKSKNSTLVDALRWECGDVASQLHVPETIRASFEPDISVSTSLLCVALKKALHMQRNSCSTLVTYPLDGFVTLMRIAANERLNHSSSFSGQVESATELVSDAVVQRFIYHLLEQQCLLARDAGPDTAASELCRVLAGEAGGIDPSFFSADVETLVGTYLLDEDALDAFRKLGAPFSRLERSGGVAIRRFLHSLADLPWDRQGDSDVTSKAPSEIFDTLLRQQGLAVVFREPFQMRALDYAQYLKQDETMGDQSELRQLGVPIY